MSNYRFYLPICLFSLLGGCHLGPKYEIPELETPGVWKAGEAAASAPIVENWWEAFQDEELAQLEYQVIEKNPNLFMAIQRVAEARATAGVVRSRLFPELNLKPVYDNIGELIELYGVPEGLFPGLHTITRVHELIYQLPVAMSYEVDLWGKFRGTYQAAKIYAEARDEALRATLLTLTSDLASNYYNLRSLDTQIELLSQLLQLRRKALDLTKSRFKVGLANYLDVMNAERQLSDSDAEYQDSLRQRTVFENAIAVLIGCPASEVQLGRAPLVANPPQIPAGIPSEVLIRRPDVAQAERTMAAAHQLIGVAYSTYFPSILLTGALGYSTPDLSQFLTWAGRFWQLGANISQMLFNAGRNRSYVDAALAKFREEKGAYEQVILTSFQEVEDALNNVEQQKKQFEALHRSYAAAYETAVLSRSRYEKGIVNFLDTLVSEEVALEAQRAYQNVLGLRYQSTIQLIKALGGSWSVSSETPAEEASGGCQIEQRNQRQGPNIVQHDLAGQILQKKSP